MNPEKIKVIKSLRERIEISRQEIKNKYKQIKELEKSIKNCHSLLITLEDDRLQSDNSEGK